MTVEAFDAPAGLRQLIAEGGLTEDGLRSAIGIGEEALRSVVSYGPTETGLTTTAPAVSAEEGTRLSMLAAQLEGMRVPDDERLKGILETLTIQLSLTPQNIARLAGLDINDVNEALNDPQTLPADKKYEIAVRASYLLNAFGRATAG